ncbi:hypothetical protein ACWEP8_12140 [Streptomyces hydrogenans]
MIGRTFVPPRHGGRGASVIAGIGLCAFGIFGLVWGATRAFNLRGTADRQVARLDAVRAVQGARTLDLAAGAPSGLPAWFFQALGGLVLLCSPLPILGGLVIAFR